MRTFLIGLAAALALGSAARAQSAPVALYNSTGEDNAPTSPAGAGCAAGSVALAYVGNTSNRTHLSFADSAGNIYTAGPVAGVTANYRLQAFRSVLTSPIVTGVTTFTLDMSSAATAQISVACYPSATALDTEGADSGASGAFGGMTVTTGPTTANVQMTVAFFLGNRWTSMTPQPPTGWTLVGDTTGGGVFGIKTYHLSAASGASPQAIFTAGLSSTTWLAAWAGLTYTAPPPSRPRRALLGVGF